MPRSMVKGLLITKQPTVLCKAIINNAGLFVIIQLQLSLKKINDGSCESDLLRFSKPQISVFHIGPSQVITASLILVCRHESDIRS